MENIRGEFKIQLAGQERTLKASFGAIETLETRLLKRGIMQALSEGMANQGTFTDIVAVIHTGLVAAKDTRMSMQEVGDAIMQAGLINFIEVYVEYLTYCITGGQRAKGGSSGESAAPDSQ